MCDLSETAPGSGVSAMSTSVTRPRTEAKPRTERPKVYKVILLNDDYTPASSS